jgi:hypothetical protein
MKRLFFIALPALLASTPVLAQVDPKIAAQCKDARDFVGCVKAFTTPAAPSTDNLTALRNAMKQVAGRLSAGTSLNDSTETFRPVVDQLAIVESTYPNSLAVQKARLASNLFNALRLAWEGRIKAEYMAFRQTGTRVYRCNILKASADNFDSEYGSSAINWRYQRGILGDGCKVPDNQLPEAYMRPIINRVLREGAKSPEEIAAIEKAEEERTAKLKREQELCALGPWNRYLEENPNMKTWVSANPKAAAKAKAKFIKDPKNKADCSVGIYDLGNSTSSPSFFVP